ncbi:MAG TPA: hypothetical protein VFX02_03955 [Gammaproteobacteria bacterium]|nr:hypothetical protein [Gammaproteobacteria bacterium]
MIRTLAAPALCAGLLLSPAFAGPAPSASSVPPEPPRLTVDTAYEPPHGRIIKVPRGGDLQRALDDARGGDIITLEPGAVYTGPFTLPVKRGAAWIVVRTETADKHLPPPGKRIDPSYAPALPKLVAAPDEPVLRTEAGAHHYRFIGLEVHPAADAAASPTQMARAVRNLIKGGEITDALRFSNQTLVQLGANRQNSAEVPHHIIFDRCYLHGGPRGARRGIALNSSHTAVIDSWLADFKTVGEDSQALAGWNGPGPFRIENNYLEGAGENVMFGGGTPSIPELVPSDIEIHGNHFAKPLAWKAGEPNYAGTPWTVKNLFELKNARRVHVAGNLFEHNWLQAQDGFAVLFTVRTENDAVPWAVVEDVAFENNLVRQSASGINIMGIDDGSRAGNGRARRIAIRNNLFDEIGGERWGGHGRLFQLLDGTEHLEITHNTAFQTDAIIFGERSPHRGFVFADNIVEHNEYGIIGSGFGSGRPTLERYFPQAVVQRNVMVNGAAELYPDGNFFPHSLDDVGFVDRASGDYRLRAGSQYARAGEAGAAVGADFELLRAQLGYLWPAARQNLAEEKQSWSIQSKQSPRSN